MPTQYKYALIIAEIVDYDRGELKIRLPGSDGELVYVVMDADAAPLTDEQAGKLCAEYRYRPIGLRRHWYSASVRTAEPAQCSSKFLALARYVSSGFVFRFEGSTSETETLADTEIAQN